MKEEAARLVADFTFGDERKRDVVTLPIES